MLSEQQLKIRYLNVGEVFKKREYCHIIWSLARANHLLVKKNYPLCGDQLLCNNRGNGLLTKHTHAALTNVATNHCPKDFSFTEEFHQEKQPKE